MIYVFFISLFLTISYSNETLLNTKQINELEINNYIIKVNKEKGTGFIVLNVNKNINLIFKEILNLKTYPKKISDVSNVNIYEETTDIVKAEIFIDTFFISFKNRVIHYINKDNYSVIWELDNFYSEDNYFKQMNGYWKLRKVSKNKTRVFYSNNLKFKSWIPTFLEEYLVKKGLFESTYWLKNTKKNSLN